MKGKQSLPRKKTSPRPDQNSASGTPFENSLPDITAGFRRGFQAALRGWFETAQRDLPWRRTRDPYAIVVSELMLQQTQVSKVIPFFEGFMAAFPTLESLAESSEEEVLRHWSGLGYYRRAHYLLALAREVANSHQGRFPRDRKQLLSLPGIGEYTAGAILSIAFDIPSALVDGNVERVLARVFCCQEDLSTAHGKAVIWKIAEHLVPESGAGTFNQALMELGATLCLPQNPSCPACPIRAYCQAFQQGKAASFPVKSRSSRKVRLEELVFLIEKQGSWLLTCSNHENLYPGMWQFPWRWIESAVKDQPATAGLHSEFPGISVADWREFHRLKHGVTFRQISTLFLRTEVSADFLCGNDFRWVKTTDLHLEALPSYQKKIIPFLIAD